MIRLLSLLQEKPHYGFGSAGASFAAGTTPSLLNIPVTHLLMYLQIVALVVTLIAGILTICATAQKIFKNKNKKDGDS